MDSRRRSRRSPNDGCVTPKEATWARSRDRGGRCRCQQGGRSSAAGYCGGIVASAIDAARAGRRKSTTSSRPHAKGPTTMTTCGRSTASATWRRDGVRSTATRRRRRRRREVSHEPAGGRSIRGTSMGERGERAQEARSVAVVRLGACWGWGVSPSDSSWKRADIAGGNLYAFRGTRGVAAPRPTCTRSGARRRGVVRG